MAPAGGARVDGSIVDGQLEASRENRGAALLRMAASWSEWRRAVDVKQIWAGCLALELLGTSETSRPMAGDGSCIPGKLKDTRNDGDFASVSVRIQGWAKVSGGEGESGFGKVDMDDGGVASSSAFMS